MYLLRRLATRIWTRTHVAVVIGQASNPNEPQPLEATEVRPFVLQAGQEPPYIPYQSRFVEVRIDGQRRLAALANRDLLNVLRESADFERRYRRDVSALQINGAALARFQEFFESEDGNAREALLASIERNEDCEVGIRRARQMGRKLVQLDADRKRIDLALPIIQEQAVEHLQAVMGQFGPILQSSGFIPALEEAEVQEMDDEFRRRYRLAFGDNDSSDDSDAVEQPEPLEEQPNPGEGEVIPSPTASERGRDDAADAADAGIRAARRSAIEDFQDRDAEFQQAQQNFDGRMEARRLETRLLQQRVNDGEEGAVDELAQSELQNYVDGQALTRALIDAEERYRAAKAVCQDVGADILNDDMSSMFPDISDDDPDDDNNEQVKERAQVLRPATIRWCQDLPDMVDTLLAEQAEWTRRPEVDEWEEKSVMDYDSISLRGETKKRKRIDTVLGENRVLRDQAVADWVRVTNKRPMLFHQRDATTVFSRARG